MASIDDVRQVCRRLGPQGWSELLLRHGLDIAKADLAAELARPLRGIDRVIQGFEDFALEGRRGVEPGRPALSLLYHALASPAVLFGADGRRLRDFPIAAEIEAVENYVFAAAAATLDDLRRRAGKGVLTAAVFAYEYSPVSETCHKRYADLVFSRTGVARAGTAPPRYDAARRGFTPLADDDPHAIRVSPARYAAFLAVRRRGAEADFCPMRLQEGDARRRFWVPVHKLFSGADCLKDLDLQVALTPHHVNEKIRRIHLYLQKAGHDASWKEPDLSNPPFTFDQGIAGWSRNKDDAAGTLVPVPHDPLVAPAEYRGAPLTFLVPRDAEFLASSLNLEAARGGARHAPEYVHVRTRLVNGKPRDLNGVPGLENELVRLAKQGAFRAQHYVDFTEGGWIDVSCPPLADLGAPVPACSLVTAPDFFPFCGQRAPTEWTATLPAGLRKGVWATAPRVLSDERRPANLQLPGGPFHKDDTTVTALVSLFGDVAAGQTRAPAAEVLRYSHLLDDSAGEFAPGWDVSFDAITEGKLKGIDHLASYGLGSPFPEDAKLCAALSTFWPAAAPDATRTFEYGPLVGWLTVSPLTDEESGQAGALPWDGVPGPQVVSGRNGRFAEYTAIAYADYVQNALDNRFSLRVTAHIDEKEYQNRVFATAMVYKTLGGKHTDWVILPFMPVTAGDPALATAQTQARLTLPGDVYRYVVFRNPGKTTPGSHFTKVRLAIRDERTLFADPNNRRILFTTRGGCAGKEFRSV